MIKPDLFVQQLIKFVEQYISPVIGQTGQFGLCKKQLKNIFNFRYQQISTLFNAKATL